MQKLQHYDIKKSLEAKGIFTENTKFDISKFKPLTSSDLVDILGLTIKHDEENKIATFLCQLSAFTEDSQFNISFNAPSSTGKSYIPTEVARLFPMIDVKLLAYSSPTAFFHDNGTWDKEKKEYNIDLSRKILIFLDQPHNDLVTRLRPLLSHDDKKITHKITDKTQKYGLKTKTINILGYPAVIFCSAGMIIDEQEATRFLLLSPNINQEKIRAGIEETIKKEIDHDNYSKWLEEKPERILLKERILAIKHERIKYIKITNEYEIKEKFLSTKILLKPRHQRDIKRIISLIKSFALLNLWFRDKDGSTITANDDDIHEAFALWNKISVSQELNLPPYIYEIYEKLILPAYQEKFCKTKLGITRQDIMKKHYQVYNNLIDDAKLRQQILPMLETAGLIIQEKNDLSDKRKIFIYPQTKNSESGGGVK